MTGRALTQVTVCAVAYLAVVACALTGAMGGTAAGINPGWVLATGALTVAVSAGCGTSVAAARVRTGRARGRR
ncbi:hypothetical protein [Kocuria arenosa]|uniref:hypothetical protein n=1 Tax=Kocuria arenosa TaxID=3071446 RepID=UPI0034D7453B